jgi:hypothetical protein
MLYEAIAGGDIAVGHLTAADWQRVAELIINNADLRLDAADASIVMLAERFDLTAIARSTPVISAWSSPLAARPSPCSVPCW